VFPGLAYAYYEGNYWPAHIEHRLDESLLQFVEASLCLVSLGPRFENYNVLANTTFDRERAKALSDSAEAHWQAILDRNIVCFGQTMRAGFEAQVAMFPNMMNERVAGLIDEYRNLALGWKLSGAGGGGYLILVCEKPVPGSIRVTARRETD